MTAIYLDHNASAPLDPDVFEAMRPHWLALGNPESRHGHARGPRRALERARETVAAVLNAEPDEVLFTSGGTESNALALRGLLGDEGPPARVLTSPIEHPAVAGPVERIGRRGFAVDRIAVDRDGRVDAGSMAALATGETRLATLILAHNETGVIQPVAALADRLAGLGVPVHTDAVQAVGRVPVDFRALGVATLAASAHKFHGPVGVGVLLARRGLRIERPGTPPVALAVGLAAALEKWQRESAGRIARWSGLRDRLEALLIAGLGPDAVVRTGPDDPAVRLPQTLHVGFPGLDGDALLMQLDLAGVSASLGSACASGSSRPSPSLVAMGLPADRLRSSVRFSLGAGTTEAEIDEAARRIVEAVGRIRGSE